MRAQARSSADYGPRRSPRVSTEGAPMGPGGSGDLPLRARGSTLSSEGQHGGRARISATGSQGALQGAGGWRLSTDGRGARVSVDGHPRGRSRLSTDGRGRASTDGRAPKQGWSLQEKGSVAEEIIPE